MMEQWKTIEKHPMYEVSNTGKVRNVWTREEKHQSTNRKGYRLVCLNSKTYMVHRLVAQAFIPNKFNKPVVDHLNTIRDDNRVENLRWVSYSENNHNVITHQHMRDAALYRTYNQVKAVICKETGIVYESGMEAQRRTGAKACHIYEVINGKQNRKTAGGLHWKLVA